MPRRIPVLLCLLAALGLTGCQTTYYKAMRTLGKEKRDILVSRIKDAKKDQQQASERGQDHRRA